MRPESYQKLALYKSFTYLFTYLLTHPECLRYNELVRSFVCGTLTDSRHAAAPLRACSSEPGAPPVVNFSHSAVHEGLPARPQDVVESSPVLAAPDIEKSR